MRELADVIDLIVEQIPETENLLLLRLESMKSSVVCRAPEMTSFWWHELQDLLIQDIGDPVEEWELKVEKIFTGE